MTTIREEASWCKMVWRTTHRQPVLIKAKSLVKIRSNCAKPNQVRLTRGLLIMHSVNSFINKGVDWYLIWQNNALNEDTSLLSLPLIIINNARVSTPKIRSEGLILGDRGFVWRRLRDYPFEFLLNIEFVSFTLLQLRRDGGERGFAWEFKYSSLIVYQQHRIWSVGRWAKITKYESSLEMIRNRAEI